MKMSRHEKILLIVTHCINQEVEHAEQFTEYLQCLLKYDDDDLNEQLEILEKNAVFSTTMPQF